MTDAVELHPVGVGQPLTAQARAERGSYVGCIAGALSVSEYHDALTAVGFIDVSITFTHEVADELHGTIITATKPALA